MLKSRLEVAKMVIPSEEAVREMVEGQIDVEYCLAEYR